MKADDVNQIFLPIAQMENEPMQILAETIAQCPELRK